KSLPLPVRLAAGLAVTAVERARELSRRLVDLPVTVVSEALQLSMRARQQVTELAIKGDNALAVLRPVEETPDWATFDEDKFSGEKPTATAIPQSLPGYPEMSLPQVRGRFSQLSLEALEELLA